MVIEYEQPQSLSDNKRFNNKKPQWTMYFWIPQEIHMKKGKMAGQVAHASARLSRMMTSEEWSDYISNEVKIVYKVPEIEHMLGIEYFMNQAYDPFAFYQTLVFDNTWGKNTVFGVAIRENLSKLKRWKLA